MSEPPEAPGEAAEPRPRPRPQRALKLTAIFVAVVFAGLIVGRALDNAAKEIEDEDGVATASVGSAAPDFTVELIDGGQFTLSQQLEADDRTVVVNLWASWCEPCRAETPDISAFAEANPDVKVIGVAVDDTEEAARRFAEQFDPSYDLALGDWAFEVAYPNFGLPATFVIGADGVVDEVWHGIVTVAVLEDLT